MRIGFHTFGCKLNQYETEALAFSFRREGFSVVSVHEDADVYIINTCTVTARADHKARAMIRGIAGKRPNAMVAVTGCSAQLEVQALSALGPNVIVIPQTEKSRLLELPLYLNRIQAGGSVGQEPPVLDPAAYRRFIAESGSGTADIFRFEAPRQSFHTRAFLKVQDGCDFRCAYCRVPLARGPSASLELREVLRRAADLERLGFREIVLTGVNLFSYACGNAGLRDLLKALLEGTRGVRLRLSSIEPQAVTEDLAAVLAHERICPHFHLPVQSGSDQELSRMGRRYASAQVVRAVDLLRSVKENPFLAADIIVGFPGQTQADFKETQRLLKALEFSALHVFPFSPRPGTAAADMSGRVPERIRDSRAAALGNLSRELSRAYRESWIGREVEVLLESGEKTSARACRGVSSNYLKVEVDGIPDGMDARGKMIIARIRHGGMTCLGGFVRCFT